jgi:biopolymer transport protein ExbD
MARKKYVIEHRAELEFNITPMIDIVFLLIIFFMCVTEMSKLDIRAGIQLPIADQARVKEPDRENLVIINVEKPRPGADTPTMYFKNRRVDLKTMRKYLHVAAELNRERDSDKKGTPPSNVEVIIRADREVEYQYVQEIMIQCAEERIWKISLVAKQVTTRNR